MPTYDFRCCKCGYEFERYQKMNDPNPPCPIVPPEDMTCEIKDTCGGPTKKMFKSAAPVHFNGGGWAKDGYSK